MKRYDFGTLNLNGRKSFHLGALQTVAPAPEPWTPAQISTAAWYDASDFNSLTLVGSGVSQWDDLSGNAHHASQSVASRQPTYSQQVNGKNVITLNGVTQYFELPVLPLTDGATAIALVRITPPDFGYAIFGGFSGQHWDLYRGSMYSEVFRTQRLSGVPVGSGFTSGTLLRTIRASSSDNFYDIRSNYTTTYSSSNSFGFSATNSLAGLGVSANGHSGSGNAYFSGHFLEFLIINDNIADAMMLRIEGYLAHKWGLTSELPDDHPHKTEAPTIV